MKALAIDLLRLDVETQSRIRINEVVVEDYAEIISGSDKWPFEPLDVFHDGNRYMVGDGFHRTLGAKKAGRASVPCRVHKGTSRDARIFAMTANDKHGLRMTREDKRACVEWLLDTFPTMTQREVAEKSGVTSRTVKSIVADRKPQSLKGKASPSPTRSGGSGIDTGKDGQMDLDGMELPTEHAPGPPRNGKEKPGASFSETIKLARSKAVKTAEALMRAVDDLHELMPSDQHEATIQHCKWILSTVKEW